MSNSVPQGWSLSTIGDTCDVLDSKRIPLNSQDRALRQGIYPYYGANGVQGYIDDFIFEGEHVLLAEDGGYFDEWDSRPISYLVTGRFWVNNHAHILKAKRGHETRYVHYSLVHTNILKHINGGTRAKLNQSDMREIAYLTPPLPEQKKIAAILSSVDDLIEKTRAQIDKLKDLKTGMMQELLTKGIGSGGVPHTEFKDSPVGRIPASWVVKTIGDLGSVVTGSTPKTASREYYGGNIPFISPSDINHSMYIRKTVNSLTEAGLKETRELPPGTVCVVCIGSTIGKTGMTTFRCATNQQVNAVICRGTHPEFVYYLLTYYSKVIKAEAGTQAVPIINKSAFSALPVQVPGYDEQVEIGNSIASVDSQISLLENKLQSANSLKKALMQDLLTGKVRVKVDQKEPAVA